MYAMTVGPYGAVFALSWNRDAAGQPTKVIWLDTEQGKLLLDLFRYHLYQERFHMVFIPIAMTYDTTLPSGPALLQQSSTAHSQSRP